MHLEGCHYQASTDWLGLGCMNNTVTQLKLNLLYIILVVMFRYRLLRSKGTNKHTCWSAVKTNVASPQAIHASTQSSHAWLLTELFMHVHCINLFRDLCCVILIVLRYIHVHAHYMHHAKCALYANYRH